MIIALQVIFLAIQFANGSGPFFIAANGVCLGFCVGIEMARRMEGRA